jgi:flagellar biosynthesis protein FlhB
MCFSIELIKQLCILAIVVGVVFAILKIVVPYALKMAGATMGEGFGIVIAVFRAIFWGFVAIVVVVFCFELIACFISWSGGISLPRR